MDFSSLFATTVSLLTLTLLEVILGIDNLVFISIACDRLPPRQQPIARKVGLLAALIARLVLLASVVWLIGLKTPLFHIYTQPFSLRDLMMIGGGLFLLYKGTHEIHQEMEIDTTTALQPKYASFTGTIFQIMVLDIIFSLDSVFTAVGLTTEYWIMATAIIIAILTMIFLSEALSKLVREHPSIKVLALSFILMIGVLLLADGFQQHIPREYLYFAIFFSIAVEFLNSRIRQKRQEKMKKRNKALK